MSRCYFKKKEINHLNNFDNFMIKRLMSLMFQLIFFHIGVPKSIITNTLFTIIKSTSKHATRNKCPQSCFKSPKPVSLGIQKNSSENSRQICQSDKENRTLDFQNASHHGKQYHQAATPSTPWSP